MNDRNGLPGLCFLTGSYFIGIFSHITANGVLLTLQIMGAGLGVLYYGIRDCRVIKEVGVIPFLKRTIAKVFKRK